MGKQAWETHRFLDEAVLKKLSDVSGAFASGSEVLTVHVAEGHQTPISAPLGNAGSDANLQAIVARHDAVAWYYSLDLGKGFVLRLQRPAEKSTDRIEVHYPDAAKVESLITLLTSVRAAFPPYARAESIDRLLGDELAEFYRARDRAVLQLEGVLQKLVNDTAEYRTRLDNEAANLRKELRAEADKRLGEYEAEYTRKNQSVEAKRAELEQTQKELDDRDSRHARRHLRGELQAELKARGERFTLTQSTARKRYVVHALFGTIVLVASIFIAATIIEYWTDKKDWVYALRVGLGFAGLVTTLFIYIRWNDEWFRQHAQKEFRLKRMSLDVDRASWVAEMAMEWQQQGKGDIPAELLSELTRDLFVSGNAASSIRHPAEDLTAAVLSASSSLRMNLPGVGEATFNRKGVQKLKQAMDASAEQNG